MPGTKKLYIHKLESHDSVLLCDLPEVLSYEGLERMGQQSTEYRNPLSSVVDHYLTLLPGWVAQS